MREDNLTPQPKQRHDKAALLVLGMHRSGTSALTGVLHRLGAKAPNTPLPPGSDNPKGFEESKRLLEVHNRILASAGSNWVDWTAFNPDWIHSAAAEPFRSELGQAYDDEFGDAALVAVKDPRICRFAPFWFEVLDKKQISALPIIAFRNPIEVAASLDARGGMPRMHGLLLWLRHVLDAEHASRGMARAFVDHRKVLDDWRLVTDAVRERLGVHWPRYSPTVEAEIDTWVDRSLRHQVASESAALADRKVAEWVRGVYARLLEMERKGETAAAHRELDHIRGEFDRASQAFGAFCHQYESKANWSSNERQKAVAAKQAAETAKQVAETTAKSLETRNAELERATKDASERSGKSEQHAASLVQELAANKQAFESKVKLLELKVAEQQQIAAAATESLAASELQWAKLVEESAAKERALTASVQALEAKVAEQQRIAAAATENLAASEQRRAKLAEESAAKEQALTASVEALKAKLAEQQQVAAAATESLAASELQRAKLAEESAVKEQALTASVEALESKVAQQQLATAEVSKHVEELIGGKQAFEAQVKSLEKKLAEQQKEAADTDLKLSKAEQQSASLSKELAAAKASAEASAKSFDARAEEFRRAAEDLASKLARAQQDVDTLSEELAISQHASKTVTKSLEGRIVDLETQSSSAENDAALSKQRVATLVEELTTVKAASDATVKSLEGRLIELQAKAAEALERLAAKLGEEQAERNRAYNATIASLEARVAELKSAARAGPDFKGRFEALSRVHLASEERVAKLTAELIELRKEKRAASPSVGGAEGKPDPVQPEKRAQSAASNGSSVTSAVRQMEAGVGIGTLEEVKETKSKPTAPPHAKPNGSADPAGGQANGKIGLPNGALAGHTNGSGHSAVVAPVGKLDHIEDVRPYFDREFYLRRYPDIARALDRGTIKGGDPLTHYLEFGGKEKRDPSPWFSSEFYLSTHPDVAKAGVNPLVHYVTAGKVEGRPYGVMSAGTPLFDAFSSILGKSPKEAEALLTRRRADLRERLQTGELGRMVQRASELEPLVRHSTLAAIRAGITPFRNEGMTAQIVAMHRMQEAAGWRRAKALVLIPWVHLSGATRIAGHLCHALAEIYGPEEVVVIRTETSEFQFPEWFPEGCRHIDFAGEAARVRPDARLRLLVEFLRSLCPAAIFNVNSRLMWDVMEPYGKALADVASVYAYLFCNDKNVHGDWVGYPVRNFHRFFDDFAAVITDSRFLAKSLQDQFHLPPDQQGKLVTLDTPADATVPVAVHTPKKPDVRPQVFWAGRFDRQKRVDIAYAIARRMPDIDFRMWGEAVLDKTAGGMKTPDNVKHEGVYQKFTDLPLGECDAWLYTSEWDGVPNMLIEVAAAAIPLVGSLAGGTSDVLVDELSHPIADIEDVNAYVKAIREILAKPDLARKRALKLREKIYRERNSAVYLDAVRSVLPKQSLK